MRSDIAEQAQQAENSQFTLVDIDDHVVSVLSSRRDPTFSAQFGDAQPPSRYTLGVGDTVVVTLWEAGAGGLFSAPMMGGVSTGSHSTVVPEQQVGQDKSITIPYAGQTGRISVSGLTTSEVEKLIVEKLTGSAIQPQALVTVTRSASNSVTVLGEVTTGARLPLSPRGDRVLDVVAGAGGLRAPVHETYIGLTRNKRTVFMPMQALLIRPEDNVYVRPQDTLTVVRRPQTFTAFGATMQNAVVPFDAIGITLEEAVAKSGGLLDQRADPSGVYLLRFEDPNVVRALVPPGTVLSANGLVRMVYRLDMRKASAIFLARQLRIRDKDALYVANSPSTDTMKFLTLFNLLASPGISAVGVANALN